LTHNDPGSQALADGCFYRADNSTINGEVSHWRPSIHMPKRASRLTLIVTGYRIERLHDIDEAGAIAEGVEEVSAKWPPNEADDFEGAPYPSYADYGPNANGCFAGPGAARLSYMKLWNAINGPDAWAANPWVEVTSYTPHLCNIDRMAA
jgi:hypothetical protein